MNLDHLVERLKKNRKDEQAQSALYTELLPDLVSWYERHGFSPHDSEDLAHDAIFKIIEKIKQCRYEPNKFIWTVAKNIARDKWRAPKISSYDSNKDTRRSEETPQYDPMEGCVAAGLARFQNEEGGERAAVIAWRIDNVSPKDIAQRIGRSYDATRQFIMQSMKKFKPFVMHCFDRPGEES